MLIKLIQKIYNQTLLFCSDHIYSETTDLTRWYNDPLLLCGAAGWGGSLRAAPWLWVRGLVGQRSPITVTHMSGPFSHTAVHWGLTAVAWMRQNKIWRGQMFLF